jgi:hypothetical protein
MVMICGYFVGIYIIYELIDIFTNLEVIQEGL